MDITKQQLAELEKFQKNLSQYHDAANAVWAARREYASDADLEKKINREKAFRDKLTIEYGGLEDIINNLLGGKPVMVVPNIPGYQWDIYAEALSARLTSTKGDCLSMAEQSTAQAVGKARQAVKAPKVPNSATPAHVFSDELLGKIKNPKIKKLCEELNRSLPHNPNSAALLMRTVLLITLQQKMGSKAKDDLAPVLNQAISQDVYGDTAIKRILTNFAGLPKTLLDATHHSQWMIFTVDDINSWLPGLVKVIEATYP